MAAGSDAKRAVFRAARRVTRGWVPSDRLPTLDEVRSSVVPRPTSSGAGGRHDRLDRLAVVVGMLATVRRDPAKHPEGDALEHALQVFHMIHAERPYDEELLTAALVREVGLAIDRRAPLESGLEAVGDLITPRTAWLVESMTAARGHGDGTLGHRARQRLERHPDFESVMLLAWAERRGRVRGGEAPTLEEAFAILRELDGEEDVDTGPI